MLAASVSQSEGVCCSARPPCSDVHRDSARGTLVSIDPEGPTTELGSDDVGGLTRRYSIVIAALVSLTLIVSCGGETADDARPVAVERSSSSTSERTTTTAQRATSTTSTTSTSIERKSINPMHPVVVSCDGSEVKILASYSPSTEALRVEYRVDLARLFSAAGMGVGYADECSHRTRFNQDFSQMLMHVDGHAVVVDLREERVIDLTAPRQGSGFSNGAPLKEFALMFEPIADALMVGSRVLVGSGDRVLIVDPANPADTQEYSGGYDRVKQFDRGSGADYNDQYHGRSLVSPDGRFVISGGPSGDSHVLRVGTDMSYDLLSDCDGFPEGWRDAATAIVSGRKNWYLVSVGDSGAPTACTPIFPDAGRGFTGGRARLDGQAVFVTVDGGDRYVADLSRPGSEPTSGYPSLRMDPNWRVYGPRAR